MVAYIDDADYDRVSQFRWRARETRGCWYALQSGSYRHPESLHRFILNASKGSVVDHIDGNGLNNQRHNLRFVSHGGNVQNSKKSCRNTSGYKGARFLNGHYYAYININGRKRHFGGFTSLEDAARGYDALARQHFGEFARLNFPDTAEVKQ